MEEDEAEQEDDRCPVCQRPLTARRNFKLVCLGDLVAQFPHAAHLSELPRGYAAELLPEESMWGQGATSRRNVVVVLTMFGTDEHVLSALRAGEWGFLLKNSPADAPVDAVRRAAAGGAVLDPVVTPAVVAAAAGARTELPPQVNLTRRELELLRLLARPV